MRIPLAWGLLLLIVTAAGGIVWLIAGRGSAPTNAVLIAGVPSQAASITPIQTARAATTPLALVVYVSGEVAAPGVYTLPAESRVADAVSAAGGFTDQANRQGINLAARLSDEQHISVPRQGEAVGATEGDPNGGAQDTGGGTSGNPTSTSLPTSKVNINTATAMELEALPGIGEVLAARIVADREDNGPFKTVDDLMRVPGIKEGLMSQLRGLVTVGP